MFKHLPPSLTHPLSTAILLLFALITSNPTFAANCSTNKIDKFAIVTKVYDGDTLKLNNGQKVRLIGINTPEMRYGKGKPEPFAKKAKQMVSRKTLKRRVGLRYGKENKDRYGRRLAHVFLENGNNLQQMLLEEGLASNVAHPPNLWQQKCYSYAEKQAKLKKRGLWNRANYRPIAADKINSRKTGFRFVTGTVSSFSKNRKKLSFHLTPRFTVQIHRSDLPYFKNFYEKDIVNKRITVKGWVSKKKNNFYMRIRHPSAIQY